MTMKTFLIILILMVSIPAAYGHAVIIGSSVNEIPHDHPPNELGCENPDSEGFCFKFIPASAINDGIIILIVLVSSIAVTVLIIFGKDITRLIKKRVQ